jgi:hypothetical protein
MGVVTNGDFEAGGGSTQGWQEDYGPHGVGWAGLYTQGANHAGWLSAFMWSYPDPFDPNILIDENDTAALRQTITVPTGTAQLSFVYYLEQCGGTFEVVFGGDILWTTSSTTSDWTSVDFALPNSFLGVTGDFEFRASSGFSETFAFVDYVSLTPEPGTLGLLAVGILGLSRLGKRDWRK